MLSDESRQIAEAAKRLYSKKLRVSLEASDLGKFVCIEPKSGNYFIGENFDDAVNMALAAYPNRRTHTLRIGHEATLHLGVLKQ